MTVIVKRTVYLDDEGPGQMKYKVALSDEYKTWYLNITPEGSVITSKDVSVQ